MRFVIKTDSVPISVDTNDWIAGETKKTGMPFLNISNRTYRIDNESFELIYDMSNANAFTDDMVAVLDKGHISIWRI